MAKNGTLSTKQQAAIVALLQGYQRSIVAWLVWAVNYTTRRGKSLHNCPYFTAKKGITRY